MNVLDPTSSPRVGEAMLPAASGQADGALVERLRRGDPRAYEKFVSEHGGRLLAVARRILASEEDARDAVQETFITAFRSIGGFRGQCLLSTWLHRIAVNTCLMQLRRRSRAPEQPIEPLLPVFDETGHHAEPVRRWSADAEARLCADERAALVRAAIRELPGAYREVLQLRDIEELGTEEVAEALGVTANAVRIRLHRARQALRTKLDRLLADGIA